MRAVVERTSLRDTPIAPLATVPPLLCGHVHCGMQACQRGHSTMGAGERAGSTAKAHTRAHTCADAAELLHRRCASCARVATGGHALAQVRARCASPCTPKHARDAASHAHPPRRASAPPCALPQATWRGHRERCAVQTRQRGRAAGHTIDALFTGARPLCPICDRSAPEDDRRPRQRPGRRAPSPSGHHRARGTSKPNQGRRKGHAA